MSRAIRVDSAEQHGTGNSFLRASTRPDSQTDAVLERRFCGQSQHSRLYVQMDPLRRAVGFVVC